MFVLGRCICQSRIHRASKHPSRLASQFCLSRHSGAAHLSIYDSIHWHLIRHLRNCHSRRLARWAGVRQRVQSDTHEHGRQGSVASRVCNGCCRSCGHSGHLTGRADSVLSESGTVQLASIARNTIVQDCQVVVIIDGYNFYYVSGKLKLDVAMTGSATTRALDASHFTPRFAIAEQLEFGDVGWSLTASSGQVPLLLIVQADDVAPLAGWRNVRQSGYEEYELVADGEFGVWSGAVASLIRGSLASPRP